MSTPRPNALDRIQKLDRAERLRLEAAEQRERTRVDALGSSVVRRPEFERVERFARRTNWPMAVLGVLWGALAVVLLTTNLDRSAPVELVWVLVVIWALVVVEFLSAWYWPRTPGPTCRPGAPSRPSCSSRRCNRCGCSAWSG